MTAENIAISFARVLRGAGVSVPLDSVLTFVQALEVVSLEHREDVYWAGRATLVRKPEDHGIFDRAFAVFWEQRQAGHVPDEEPPQKITLLIDDEDDGADKAPEAVDDNPTLTLRFSATETLREKEKDEEIINLFTSIHKIQSKQPRRDQLITYHRKYDENNNFIDSVPFNFDNQESEGTKKLLYLLGPWYDTLKNGKILAIDELDSRLHSNLTLKLVDFFHKFNESNAQLIFAVHDISILNKDTFRRDQIWFVEKNQFGASELLSLADFKTDKGSLLLKRKNTTR
jgi:hypothetical protein